MLTLKLPYSFWLVDHRSFHKKSASLPSGNLLPFAVPTSLPSVQITSRHFVLDTFYCPFGQDGWDGQNGHVDQDGQDGHVDQVGLPFIALRSSNSLLPQAPPPLETACFCSNQEVLLSAFQPF